MKLSIIVPVYNTEAYVAKCLDSLIEPDLGGYEIIAVNDGSTDSSGEVVRRYEERYPDLVKVVDTPNGGLSHARNVGIEASEADYLLFIDSDDYVSDRAMIMSATVPSVRSCRSWSRIWTLRSSTSSM